jgi:hypothetical protein
MARSSKSRAGSLQWSVRPKTRNAWAGTGRIQIWHESTETYRIDRYVAYDIEPFFALLKRFGGTKRRWELISRHADLAGAIRACELHAAAGT